MKNPAENRDTEPYLDRVCGPTDDAQDMAQTTLLVESREHARIPYYLECNVYGSKRFCCGRMINLSRGGVRIHCYDLMAVGEIVHVDCELPGGRLWVEAQVAWVNKGSPIQSPGMGLRFVNLSEESIELVEEALCIAAGIED